MGSDVNCPVSNMVREMHEGPIQSIEGTCPSTQQRNRWYFGYIPERECAFVPDAQRENRPGRLVPHRHRSPDGTLDDGRRLSCISGRSYPITYLGERETCRSSIG